MRYDYDVLIVGSGAAGYAVAERLYDKGIENICIVTENRFLSTSRCSGSDKQTYYKLDISSPEGDSVLKMAQDMFAGGSMNGTDAFLESVNSLPCFMHLCELGVPFPRDEFGVYHGYRTDHDKTKRATSCGPLTSKYMTEKLEKRVLEQGTEILDKTQVIKLAINEGKCHGAFCLTEGKIRYISSHYTVLCTGAPSGIYADSVYPVGHKGATGLAIEAGAELSNYQEWQYGIASTKFRWNLSGSYQQVIPKYVSVDENGKETELTSDCSEEERKAFLSRIFLKGYEWPFNSERTEGSSLVDIKVMDEISKGRKVFLDYRSNPELFSFDALSKEAYEYLKSAGVDGKTPYERLMQLNPKAIKLYLDHGIDLSSEMLEISVCSQHNNGGIRVHSDGETTVSNLYCSGEASGRFGIYRPGGAALNDTQVSALLISESISRKKPFSENVPDFEMPSKPTISEVSNVKKINEEFGRRMSDNAGIVRKKEELIKLTDELRTLADNYSSIVTVSDEKESNEYFALYHTTLARLALCRTELESLEKCGSRGGCICVIDGKKIEEDKKYRKYITITTNEDVHFEPVDDIPEYECSFETLLAKN